MLHLFTLFADWLVLEQLGFDQSERLGSALHFFVEDTTKIFALLVVMIYLIALARASLRIERVRDYLAGKNRFLGYGLGSMFGAITPFCSCSSIPLFLGFTSAGIPIGTTMAFLLTSPLINEVAIVLLGSLLGWKFTLAYIMIGMTVGIVGGFILDSVNAGRLLQPFARKAFENATATSTIEADKSSSLTLAERHQFAVDELKDIFGRVWKWVFIGVGLGGGATRFRTGWLD